MNRIMYKAAMEGEFDVLERTYNDDQLDDQITPNQNTLLHVAAQFGHNRFVAKILEWRPSLLRRVNTKGKTPLHIAARKGYYRIVKELIACARELDYQELESGRGGATTKMLRAENLEKDTALHMAVRNAHLEVVDLLTKNDPKFLHPANKMKETPLYLAAERYGCVELVSVILENCESPTYSGPGGRTALHAAAISRTVGSTEMLLRHMPDLINKVDEYGWTPLHYAARCGDVVGAKKLLETDRLVAYVTASEDDENTALHIAAAFGMINVMKEILSQCPDCWEIVNGKGRNILHIAVDMERQEVITFILENFWLPHLIDQKDTEGNTPLHLFAASSLKGKMSLEDRGEYYYAFNNGNFTPRAVEFSPGDYYSWIEPIGSGRNIVRDYRDNTKKSGWKAALREQERVQEQQRIEQERVQEQQRRANAEAQLRKNGFFQRQPAKDVEGRLKAAEKPEEKEETKPNKNEEKRQTAATHMIVATLITTIAFAANFTIPGGYDGNQGREQGMAVLVREVAFKAFVMAKTVAVISSACSVLLYISASLYHVEDEIDKRNVRYQWAFFLIVTALIAMMVAFITGTYAILAHSRGIAIVATGVSCISFLVYSFELGKLCNYYRHKD